MLLRVFKQNQPSVQFILPLLFCCFGASLFFGDLFIPSAITLSFSSISIPIFYPVIVFFLLLIVISLEAVMVNRLAEELNVYPKNNFLPSLFFLLFFCSFSQSFSFSSVVIGNFFLLLSLKKVQKIKSETITYSKCFDAAFYIGIACLFSISFLPFLAFYFLALFISRSFNWRELLLSLIGFITPLMIYFSVLFLMGASIEQETFYFGINNITSSFLEVLTIALIVITLLIAIPLLLSSYSTDNIQERKSKTIVLYLFVASVVATLLQQDITLLIIPLSIILPYFYLIRFKKITVFFLLIWIALAINNQYQFWSIN